MPFNFGRTYNRKLSLEQKERKKRSYKGQEHFTKIYLDKGKEILEKNNLKKQCKAL